MRNFSDSSLISLMLLWLIGGSPPVRARKVECALSTEENFSELAEASEVIAEAGVVSQSSSDPSGNFAVTFKIRKTIKGKDLKKNHEVFYLRLNLVLLSPSRVGGRESSSDTCPVLSRVRPGRKYLLFLKKSSSLGFVPLGSPIKRSKKLLKALKSILCSKNGPIIKKLFVNSSGKFNEGELVKLRCKVLGKKGKTHVEWFKDGKPLKTSRRTRIRTKHLGKHLQSSIISIRRAVAKDRGVYECRASNGKEVASISAKIRVIKKRRSLKHSDSSKFLRGTSCPITSYCLNGGKCVYYRALGELTCICASGYRGKRCEHKDLYDRAVSFNRKMGLSPMCVLGLTHYPC